MVSVQASRFALLKIDDDVEEEKSPVKSDDNKQKQNSQANAKKKNKKKKKAEQNQEVSYKSSIIAHLWHWKVQYLCNKYTLSLSW